MLGLPADEILRISAKTGEGVPALLDAVIERVPRADGRPRRAAAGADLRLVLRPVPRRDQRRCASSTACCAPATKLRYLNAPADHDAEEIGVRLPDPTPGRELGPGEVGYLIAGIKDVGEAKVGETVTDAAPPGRGARRATASPSRWCSAASTRSTATSTPTCARPSSKLRLNDSSFTYEPGDLGRARLRLPLRLPRPAAHGDHPGAARARVRPVARRDRAQRRVPGAPHRRHVELVDNPSSLPTPSELGPVEEPYVNVTIITPTEYVGTLMELAQGRRGEMRKMDYLSDERVELDLLAAAGEIVIDFFDQLKSRTRGYASLDYEPAGTARRTS